MAAWSLPAAHAQAVYGSLVGNVTDSSGGAIPGATVLDALLESVPVTPGEARAYLARFLFRGDDVFKEVRLLSGGEQARALRGRAHRRALTRSVRVAPRRARHRR